MKRHLPALLALVATPLFADSELIPFTLPWNDDAPGITDLSHLNHDTAGQHGYIAVDAHSHFTAGGERVRLWGVNITSHSCFPTHAEAEGIAARLAKFGFNIVRFHHMDNNWGGGSLIDYARGNSRHLHPANLEKLDYFIAQLKSHGIYSNLNLINSRDFKVADGLDPQTEAQLDAKERHILGFVDPTFRDLEKEFARSLLAHTNPYTGLTYAEDPAIAVVEINNENGIFHQYYGGSLNKWPKVYKNQLQGKWNAWLQSRYPDTASLLAAWSGDSEPFGPEKIANPSFANGLANWNSEQHQGAAVTATTGTFHGRLAIKLDVTTTSQTNWHGQLNQSSLALEKDQLYTLTFWTRADAARTFSVGIGLAYAPYSGVHSYAGLTATTDWQKHSYTFTAGVSDNNLRLNISNYIGQTGALYFTDFSLRSGADLTATLPTGQSLEVANIASNTSDGSYLPKRNLDWTRFLSELATDYWTDMRDYIKTDLGYGGLVNGTTIMNSTPNIQGVYDLVDTHAYWQHPQFPGTPWDPNNWTVEPTSMVNTLDNTLAGLAKQRVHGYPHTVSEYQHAYPNPFASEGPLLVAAYASLQDWDGIYFFDYSKGSSGAWDQGYWDGYFNMNAHPSAMANALAGAQIFRQGHVAPAAQQVLLNFSPETETHIVATQGRAWKVGDGRDLDIPHALALTHRIALSIGDSPSGQPAPPAAPDGPAYPSDTDELNWDLSSPNKGVVTINTPKTRSLIGYIDNRRFDIGNVGIEIATTQEDWATLTLTARQGSFDQPYSAANILLVATGLTENTGMLWTDSTKSSVGSNWGRAPSLTEAIPATITLPYPADRTTAWPLDQTGQRLDPIPLAAKPDGTSSLAIGSTHNSLWYEIEVAAGDPYQSWRQSIWTDPAALADDSLSGPSADPDGDRIPNLVEYFADLDPNSPDTRSPIQQSVTLVNGKPTFTYQLLIPADYPLERLRIATTADLQTWQSHSLEADPIHLQVTPHNATHHQLTLTHRPITSPAFSRFATHSEHENSP
ncbi:carbohydrate binding domain-containing protein [Pelagicoccus sp. SDUM812005]|uniref:carbohydrate binding domain-containing protein n=1 Tax=Pelagicoccus sp. SDUM812005 TaxID=3041257 RepID=UPI00280C4222|nr:carbohydrate binding domain-containing protein [Pelagicoccus sp. SDUM812005]MDQ8181997.1 carbohydrate binding domain-containing protein [Pelagicoccus sp. SDUM812005]